MNKALNLIMMKNYFDDIVIEKFQLVDDLENKNSSELDHIVSLKLREYIHNTKDERLLKFYLSNLIEIYLEKKINSEINTSFRKVLKF